MLQARPLRGTFFVGRGFPEPVQWPNLERVAVCADLSRGASLSVGASHGVLNINTAAINDAGVFVYHNWGLRLTAASSGGVSLTCLRDSAVEY